MSFILLYNLRWFFSCLSFSSYYFGNLRSIIWKIFVFSKPWKKFIPFDVWFEKTFKGISCKENISLRFQRYVVSRRWQCFNHFNFDRLIHELHWKLGPFEVLELFLTWLPQSRWWQCFNYFNYEPCILNKLRRKLHGKLGPLEALELFGYHDFYKMDSSVTFTVWYAWHRAWLEQTFNLYHF